MHILVLNCGSSSLKFQVIETSQKQIENDTDRVLARGSVERIGFPDAKLTYEGEGVPKQEKAGPVNNHQDAIRMAFECLTAQGTALAQALQIEAVGHRIVHGGDTFRESVRIDDAVLRKIEALSDLAPLHNPMNLKGVYASRELLPDATQVAVFDTAFHQTLPTRAYLYGIPYEFYTRNKVRRYGFHGTSFRYVSSRYASLQKTTAERLKLVVCHLGNGCSMCAIEHGRSIDTSMGFTPMDGLLMGTRPGEIDPGAVLYLTRRDAGGAAAVDEMLNHHAGLAGITGGTSDMRDLLAQREKGSERAGDAIDVFCYRIAKTVGAYLTILKGADAILFTGGIGEHASAIRQQVGESLSWLGISLNRERNTGASGSEARISDEKSSIAVWVIPTNEELWIARDTFGCASSK